LKPERWGSQLVEEEKCQGEKACDKQNNNNNNYNDNNKNNNNINSLHFIYSSL
jgi:hypothetical protein